MHFGISKLENPIRHDAWGFRRVHRTPPEAADEKLIVDIDNNLLKPGELVKTFSAATDQVAAKRRWNQGLGTGDDRTQDALAAALQRLRDGHSIQIKPPDPANQAVDTTPSDEAGETTGPE